jgi:hypothetical protein
MHVPIWIINLVTSVVAGWGTALIFVGAQTYITACANESN